MRLRFVLALAGLLLATAAQPARACAVCAPSAPLTVAQRLIDAERALLAHPEPGPPAVWRVVAVVRGESDGGPPALGPGTSRDPQGRASLLVRDRLSKVWTVVGPIAEAQADWLRGLAVYRRTAEMTPHDWTQRVAALAPLLEHPEPLVAETAYGEIARAPYAAMRANRAAFDGAQLARWVEEPALAPRRPLYLLLLGLAGGPADATRIERALAARRPGSDPVDLPALLAADLELNGPRRLARIEKTWLLDPVRSPAEVRAAVVALSVHGGEGGVVRREAVAEVFLRFTERRAPLGGLVAQDLAAWRVWEATQRFAALVDTSDVPIWSKVAMVQYLRESPRPEAKAALERIARAR
jgi:hypothetical protein